MTVDFQSAKDLRLSAVIGQSIKLRKLGREWVGCCPFHDEKTPSFTVNDDKGFAHCFGCGWHGDAADFVAKLDGCGLREAVARVTGGDIPKAPARAIPDKCETLEAAKRIWREALPIEGTPAQTYLANRGLWLKLPPTLRFSMLRHPSGGVHPCLVALITTPSKTIGGVHRIYLTDEGAKAAVNSVKLSLGKVSGNAIRLAPASPELIVCEALEDALTLQQELGKAAWAAGGASMLASMQFPDCVRSVVIGRDGDDAGTREAEKAAEAFAGRGLSVRIMAPPNGAKDFNEYLMASGDAGRVAA